MAHLLEPLNLRDVSFRNRIMVSPMCQYSCKDGMPGDWHLVHLGSRAVGGAALVMAEATAVTPEGRISPEDLGLWSDAHLEPLRRVFAFVAQQGAVPGIQLAHAGRKASTAAPWKGGNPVAPADGGWVPIYAPSALPFAPGSQTPQALTAGEIAQIVRAFAAAAQRALAAGAKVVELHAAHGYLAHSFLSPLSNQRTDPYGGSFDNRTRMLRETVEAVRKVWPQHLPLLVRVSCTDWVEGGWTIEESVALARMLKPLGVDAIDCSSGGLVPGAKVPVGPGYQVAFAQRVRAEAQLPTIAVGMITSPAQADQIIRTGQADAVMMARELLRDPYWPLRAARDLGHEIRWPEQYERARSR
jgi:2,4-dienoyl-CoA reductase-like NADH-dependent reductase (Old Yellow Enzyme family)